MADSATMSSIDWEAAGDEMITHLRALLQADTRNPPGNEIRAAEYLARMLDAEGIPYEIVGPTPDRATIVARLQGDGSEPPLLLMSHTDVVAVEPDKWTHDPFAAEIVDDQWIYARGALDMKQMVTMELMTMLLLKRSGVALKRDVIFMAAADEETGGRQGARWVADNRPELIRAEYALNEGGGHTRRINGKLYCTVQTAEKGTARFRLRTTGTPGHGSKPHGDNPIIKLARILDKLTPLATPVHLTKSFRGFIEGVAGAQTAEAAQLLRAVIADEAGTDAAIDALPLDESTKIELHAMVRNTVAPTMLSAGSQINVIPSEAEAGLDCRLLPGWTPDRFLQELRSIVGDDVAIEWLEPSAPLEADPESALFDVIAAVLRDHAPDVTPIPTLLTGATDAKNVAHLGIKVYGFAPWPDDGPTEWDRIHGHDERISLHAARWGVRVLYDVVERFVTH